MNGVSDRPMHGSLEGGMNGPNPIPTFERQAVPSRRIEHPREGEQKPSIRRAGLSCLGLSHCGVSYQAELSKSFVLEGNIKHRLKPYFMEQGYFSYFLYSFVERVWYTILASLIR